MAPRDAGRVWRRRLFWLVCGLAAGLGVASPSMGGQQPRVAATAPMKIGIFRSGRQGGAPGLQWAKAGHDVFFPSRNPDSLTEFVGKAGPKAKAGRPRVAAAFGDVILIEVPPGRRNSTPARRST